MITPVRENVLLHVFIESLRHLVEVALILHIHYLLYLRGRLSYGVFWHEH